MHAKIALILCLMLIFVPFVHAQSTNLQPLWDAINNIGLAIQTIQQDIQNIQSFGIQFAQDVVARLDVLDARVDGIETVGIQFIVDTNNSIIGLQQTDENLQQQITTITNTPPSFTINRSSIYEVSNSSPGTTTVYCNDATDILLTGYCAGGFFGASAQSQGILFDDFSDGEYASNPPWFTTSGTWNAGAGELIGGTTDTSTIYTNVNMQSGRDYFMSYKIRQLVPNTLGSFKWYATGTSPVANGYDLVFHETGDIRLLKWVGGSPTVLTSLGSFNPGINYDININHMQSGNILIYLDGALNANIVDTTYSGGSLVSLWTGNGASIYAFDNFSIGHDNNQLNQAGYLNVSDANQSMGILCSDSWEARIICLDQ